MCECGPCLIVIAGIEEPSGAINRVFSVVYASVGWVGELMVRLGSKPVTIIL